MRTQKIQDRLLCIIMTFAFALLASGRALFVRYDINAVLLIVIYLLFSVLPFVVSGATPTVRLRICRHGQICLCAFAGALALAVVVHIVKLVCDLRERGF